MIKRLYINNILYDIEDGLSIKETATEELDSCVFQMLNVEKIQLEPMQKVMVEFMDDSKKFFVVNTWVEEPSTFDTNLKNYIISCSSETKKLERVQLPNLAITQPLFATKRNYHYFVNNVFNIYISKMYPELVMGTDMVNLLSNQVAVEEIFNTLSAKDYFNSVLEKTAKLVSVENNIIKPFTITEKGNPINTENLFFLTNEEKIEDYYSQIRSDVEGVQSDDSTIITEVVGMRAPDEAILTTDNAIIKLSHNINYIKKIVVYLHAKVGTATRYIKAIINSDTRKSVVEKAEYDLMKVSNVANVFDDDLKRMHLYYTRGSNTIEGFNYDEGKLLDSLLGKHPLVNIITKMFGEAGSIDIPEDFDDIRKVKFEITYSALDDVSLVVNKEKTYNSEIRDNQSESYIDLDKFAKNEQLKLNRLGNPTMPIAARYDNLQDVPKLLDYIDDYILAEKEVVYHSDFIDFKGTLYKNYTNRDLFYGVNAKKRTTPLLSGNEAVTRKDVTKLKYKFEFEDKTEDKSTTRYLLGKLASTNYFVVEEDEIIQPDFMLKKDFRPIAIAVGTSTFSNSNQVQYKLEPDVRKANNSVTINFKFEDNLNVGIKQGRITVGGYSQQYVTYTDNNGELDYITIDLYDQTTLSEYSVQGVYFGLSEENFKIPNSFPEVDNSILKNERKFLSVTSRRNKDSREILNETIQIEFNGSENIIVNDRLIDMLPFFNKIKQRLYIWVSNTEKYNVYNSDRVVSSATMINDDLEIDYSDFVKFNEDFTTFNRLMLYNNNVDLTNVKSWALADLNGNVFIAVNKRNTDVTIPTIIYLNEEE